MTEKDQQTLIAMGDSLKYADVLKSTTDKTNIKEQSNSKIILSLLDKKKMQETILAFPLDLQLTSREQYTYSGTRDNLEDIYDVRFVIPLIYHSVSPALLVDCRTFITKRALSLTIAGLSTNDDKMRSLCYKILERYYNHLESSLQMDRQLWMIFLDLIRNSIPRPNERLPPLFGLFLIRIIDILLHSTDPLYQIIKEFLSGMPKLEITSIELYDDLMSCHDVEKYDYSMRWVLTLFRDGIRDSIDLKIVRKLNLIPTLMCLYNSELRFKRANEVILSIFSRLTQIKDRGTSILVRGSAFLPWLDQVLHDCLAPTLEMKDDKSESLSDITKILATIVFNIIDNLHDREDNHLHSSSSIELMNVYLSLHDLILKSEELQIMTHHMYYASPMLKILKGDSAMAEDVKVAYIKLLRTRLCYFDQ